MGKKLLGGVAQKVKSEMKKALRKIDNFDKEALFQITQNMNVSIDGDITLKNTNSIKDGQNLIRVNPDQYSLPPKNVMKYSNHEDFSNLEYLIDTHLYSYNKKTQIWQLSVNILDKSDSSDIRDDVMFSVSDEMFRLFDKLEIDFFGLETALENNNEDFYMSDYTVDTKGEKIVFLLGHPNINGEVLMKLEYKNDSWIREDNVEYKFLKNDGVDNHNVKLSPDGNYILVYGYENNHMEIYEFNDLGKVVSKITLPQYIPSKSFGKVEIQLDNTIVWFINNANGDGGQIFSYILDQNSSTPTWYNIVYGSLILTKPVLDVYSGEIGKIIVLHTDYEIANYMSLGKAGWVKTDIVEDINIEVKMKNIFIGIIGLQEMLKSTISLVNVELTNNHLYVLTTINNNFSIESEEYTHTKLVSENSLFMVVFNFTDNSLAPIGMKFFQNDVYLDENKTSVSSEFRMFSSGNSNLLLFGDNRNMTLHFVRSEDYISNLQNPAVKLVDVYDTGDEDGDGILNYKSITTKEIDDTNSSKIDIFRPTRNKVSLKIVKDNGFLLNNIGNAEKIRTVNTLSLSEDTVNCIDDENISKAINLDLSPTIKKILVSENSDKNAFIKNFKIAIDVGYVPFPESSDGINEMNTDTQNLSITELKGDGGDLFVNYSGDKKIFRLHDETEIRGRKNVKLYKSECLRYNSNAVYKSEVSGTGLIESANGLSGVVSILFKNNAKSSLHRVSNDPHYRYYVIGFADNIGVDDLEKLLKSENIPLFLNLNSDILGGLKAGKIFVSISVESLNYPYSITNEPHYSDGMCISKFEMLDYILTSPDDEKYEISKALHGNSAITFSPSPLTDDPDTDTVIFEFNGSGVLDGKTISDYNGDISEQSTIVLPYFKDTFTRLYDTTLTSVTLGFLDMVENKVAYFVYDSNTATLNFKPIFLTDTTSRLAPSITNIPNTFQSITVEGDNSVTMSFANPDISSYSDNNMNTLFWELHNNPTYSGSNETITLTDGSGEVKFKVAKFIVFFSKSKENPFLEKENGNESEKIYYYYDDSITFNFDSYTSSSSGKVYRYIKSVKSGANILSSKVFSDSAILSTYPYIHISPLKRNTNFALYKSSIKKPPVFIEGFYPSDESNPQPTHYDDPNDTIIGDNGVLKSILFDNVDYVDEIYYNNSPKKQLFYGGVTAIDTFYDGDVMYHKYRLKHVLGFYKSKDKIQFPFRISLQFNNISSNIFSQLKGTSGDSSSGDYETLMGNLSDNISIKMTLLKNYLSALKVYDTDTLRNIKKNILIGNNVVDEVYERTNEVTMPSDKVAMTFYGKYSDRNKNSKTLPQTRVYDTDNFKIDFLPNIDGFYRSEENSVLEYLRNRDNVAFADDIYSIYKIKDDGVIDKYIDSDNIDDTHYIKTNKISLKLETLINPLRKPRTEMEITDLRVDGYKSFETEEEFKLSDEVTHKYNYIGNDETKKMNISYPTIGYDEGNIDLTDPRWEVAKNITEKTSMYYNEQFDYAPDRNQERDFYGMSVSHDDDKNVFFKQDLLIDNNTKGYMFEKMMSRYNDKDVNYEDIEIDFNHTVTGEYIVNELFTKYYYLNPNGLSSLPSSNLNHTHSWKENPAISSLDSGYVESIGDYVTLNSFLKMGETMNHDGSYGGRIQNYHSNHNNKNPRSLKIFKGVGNTISVKINSFLRIRENYNSNFNRDLEIVSKTFTSGTEFDVLSNLEKFSILDFQGGNAYHQNHKAEVFDNLFFTNSAYTDLNSSSYDMRFNVTNSDGNCINLGWVTNQMMRFFKGNFYDNNGLSFYNFLSSENFIKNYFHGDISNKNRREGIEKTVESPLERSSGLLSPIRELYFPDDTDSSKHFYSEPLLLDLAMRTGIGTKNNSKTYNANTQVVDSRLIAFHNRNLYFFPIPHDNMSSDMGRYNTRSDSSFTVDISDGFKIITDDTLQTTVAESSKIDFRPLNESNLHDLTMMITNFVSFHGLGGSDKVKTITDYLKVSSNNNKNFANDITKIPEYFNNISNLVSNPNGISNINTWGDTDNINTQSCSMLGSSIVTFSAIRSLASILTVAEIDTSNNIVISFKNIFNSAGNPGTRSFMYYQLNKNSQIFNDTITIPNGVLHDSKVEKSIDNLRLETTLQPSVSYSSGKYRDVMKFQLHLTLYYVVEDNETVEKNDGSVATTYNLMHYHTYIGDICFFDPDSDESDTTLIENIRNAPFYGIKVYFSESGYKNERKSRIATFNEAEYTSGIKYEIDSSNSYHINKIDTLVVDDDDDYGITYKKTVTKGYVDLTKQSVNCNVAFEKGGIKTHCSYNVDYKLKGSSFTLGDKSYKSFTSSNISVSHNNRSLICNYYNNQFNNSLSIHSPTNIVSLANGGNPFLENMVKNLDFDPIKEYNITRVVMVFNDDDLKGSVSYHNVNSTWRNVFRDLSIEIYSLQKRGEDLTDDMLRYVFVKNADFKNALEQTIYNKFGQTFNDFVDLGDLDDFNDMDFNVEIDITNSSNVFTNKGYSVNGNHFLPYYDDNEFDGLDVNTDYPNTSNSDVTFGEYYIRINDYYPDMKNNVISDNSQDILDGGSTTDVNNNLLKNGLIFLAPIGASLKPSFTTIKKIKVYSSYFTQNDGGSCD
jgi:hypothetical protein